MLKLHSSTRSELAAKDRRPIALALALPALWAAIALIVPPAMVTDAGTGFLAWRGALLGAFNSIIAPDPKNIAQDTSAFLAMWSPGQYAVPGVISLSGLPLGISIILTVAILLAACLLGWLQLLKKVDPGSRNGLLLVALIGTFHFSTLPFSIYNGGEILLQGLFPWIVLAAWRVPGSSAVEAAALGAGIVFAAFFVKLSGVIVAGAALIASGLVALAAMRRLTPGMIGGSVGALLVLFAIEALFVSRGQTANDFTYWSIDISKVTFAFAIPWVAGVGLTDFFESIFLDPAHPVFDSQGPVVWFTVPFAVFMIALVSTWRPDTAAKAWLKSFSLLFYLVIAGVFAFFFIKGAAVSLDERHFRTAGSLLFFCALIRITEPQPGQGGRWMKYAFLAFCACMSLYGVTSLGTNALAASGARSLDRTSWTNHPAVDSAAIAFLKDAYAKEGRQAVFVLPIQDIAVTLPPDARVIGLQIEFQTEEQIAALRYAGRAGGHVFVLLQNGIADSAKGRSLLAAFWDYPAERWQRVSFAASSVFFQ